MTLKEVQKNLKQVVVDKFRELNQIRNEIITECGEWTDKDPEKYTFPIGEFSEKVLFIYVLSEEVVKTTFPKKVTKVNGGIYCAVRSINTKIINLKNCTYKDILKQGFN